MIPQEWAPPCNSQCTHKYAALTQIPWRVFCKKGCDGDAETLGECAEECDELCYKDPVVKDKEWSAYFDRSPGPVTYSKQCFRACIAGCGYKLDVPKEKIDQVDPRPPKPPPEEKPVPPPPPPPHAAEKSNLTNDELTSISA